MSATQSQALAAPPPDAKGRLKRVKTDQLRGLRLPTVFTQYYTIEVMSKWIPPGRSPDQRMLKAFAATQDRLCPHATDDNRLIIPSPFCQLCFWEMSTQERE